MTIDVTGQMKMDASLERDLNRATTPEEIRGLLLAAVERSPLGITRDAQTGQFVRVEQTLTDEQRAAIAKGAADKAAADAAAAGARTFQQTVTIGGVEFDFEADSADSLERQIKSAREVSDAVQQQNAQNARANASSTRTKTKAEREREIYDRAELESQFRLGQLTTAEYLERTNAIGTYLAEKGFDVEAAGMKQFTESWEQATERFLQTDGASWPGGVRNRELLSLEISAMGLTDAPDKCAAMAQAFASLKSKNMLFSGDASAEQMNALAQEAQTPTEILEAWKEAQGGDPEAANKAFINLHRGGRFFDV